jgi:hypothetical protein
MRIRHAGHLHEYVKKEINVKMTKQKWGYSIKTGLRLTDRRCKNGQ